MSEGRGRFIPIGLAALLFLLAIVGPLLELRHFLTTPATADQGAEYVAGLSNHRELREALQGHDVIGYIADEEIDTRVGGPAQARYYLAQYALAPVLLDLDHEQYDIRLLAFTRSEAIDPYLSRHLLRRLVDVNENVVLVGPRERR